MDLIVLPPEALAKVRRALGTLTRFSARTDEASTRIKALHGDPDAQKVVDRWDREDGRPEVPTYLPDGEEVGSVDEVAAMMLTDRKTAAHYVIETKGFAKSVRQQARSILRAGSVEFKKPKLPKDGDGDGFIFDGKPNMMPVPKTPKEVAALILNLAKPDDAPEYDPKKITNDQIEGAVELVEVGYVDTSNVFGGDKPSTPQQVIDFLHNKKPTPQEAAAAIYNAVSEPGEVYTPEDMTNADIEDAIGMIQDNEVNPWHLPFNIQKEQDIIDILEGNDSEDADGPTPQDIAKMLEEEEIEPWAQELLDSPAANDFGPENPESPDDGFLPDPNDSGQGEDDIAGFGSVADFFNALTSAPSENEDDSNLSHLPEVDPAQIKSVREHLRELEHFGTNALKEEAEKMGVNTDGKYRDQIIDELLDVSNGRGAAALVRESGDVQMGESVPDKDTVYGPSLPEGTGYTVLEYSDTHGSFRIERGTVPSSVLRDIPARHDGNDYALGEALAWARGQDDPRYLARAEKKLRNREPLSVIGREGAFRLTNIRDAIYRDLAVESGEDVPVSARWSPPKNFRFFDPDVATRLETPWDGLETDQGRSIMSRFADKINDPIGGYGAYATLGPEEDREERGKFNIAISAMEEVYGTDSLPVGDKKKMLESIRKNTEDIDYDKYLAAVYPDEESTYEMRSVEWVDGKARLRDPDNMVDLDDVEYNALASYMGIWKTYNEDYRNEVNLFRANGGGYRELNSALREELPLNRYQEGMVETLQGIARKGARHDGYKEVYRGAEAFGAFRSPRNLKGMIWTDNGFVSGSMNKSISEGGFAKGSAEKILMTYEIPPNMPVIDTVRLAGDVADTHEEEVILPPGFGFEVLEDSGSQWPRPRELKVRVIPPDKLPALPNEMNRHYESQMMKRVGDTHERLLGRFRNLNEYIRERVVKRLEQALADGEVSSVTDFHVDTHARGVMDTISNYFHDRLRGNEGDHLTANWLFDQVFTRDVEDPFNVAFRDAPDDMQVWFQVKPGVRGIRKEDYLLGSIDPFIHQDRADKDNELVRVTIPKGTPGYYDSYSGVWVLPKGYELVFTDRTVNHALLGEILMAGVRKVEDGNDE